HRPRVAEQLGQQHLERDLTTVLEILGQIDRGHAPTSELALERVSVAQVGGQRGGRVGGRGWGRDTGICPGSRGVARLDPSSGQDDGVYEGALPAAGGARRGARGGGPA